MHVVTTTESTAKPKGAKGNGKGRVRGTAAAKQTLHLKNQPPVTAQSSSDVSDMIATAAYFLAERRGFEPGHELEDWLTAERQVSLLHS